MSVRFDEFAFRAFVKELFQAKNTGVDGQLHAAVGLAGEAAEILDQMKKLWVYGKLPDRAEVLEEMGDVFHYFTMLMIVMGTDLNEVTENNTTKLNKRYPDGFTKEAAIARADKAPKAFADFDHECIPGN